MASTTRFYAISHTGIIYEIYGTANKGFTDKNKPDMLDTFKVNKYDRQYQIWKREPLSIELLNESMFKQKLEYIHYNPVKAGLCNVPEEYHYSSAQFYLDGTNSFGMLMHYTAN